MSSLCLHLHLHGLKNLGDEVRSQKNEERLLPASLIVLRVSVTAAAGTAVSPAVQKLLNGERKLPTAPADEAGGQLVDDPGQSRPLR